jgi:hypothetical protein
MVLGDDRSVKFQYRNIQSLTKNRTNLAQHHRAKTVFFKKTFLKLGLNQHPVKFILE